jgi:arylamine N-acetyltransferase
VEPYLIVAPAVIGLSLIAMMFWVKQLYAEFGWAIFHVVGANPQMKSRPFNLLPNILQQTKRSDVSMVPNHDMPDQVRLLLLHRRHHAASYRCSQDELGRVCCHHCRYTHRPCPGGLLWSRCTARNQVADDGVFGVDVGCFELL